MLVDADAYLLEVCRYVDLNPVRAGMVKRPQHWTWSSYRAHTGQVPLPVWLNSVMLHRQLAPRAPRREGPERYAQFVAQGKGIKLWEEVLCGQIYLGGEAFVQRMQTYAASPETKEIPRTQRRLVATPLPWYFEQYDRDSAIAKRSLMEGTRKRRLPRGCGLVRVAC